MPLLITRFRYCLPWLALLMLGACQRASYSFQAPTGALLAPSAATRGAEVPASATAASYCALGLQQVASRPRLRPSSVVARRRPKPLVRLRRLPLLARQAVVLPRAISQAATRPEPTPGAGPMPQRTQGIALLLAFFLGGIGAHLFYLGYYGRGVAYLVGTVLGALLLFVALVVAVLTFSSGAGLLTLLAIGGIISGLVGVLALIDAIRIAIGDLKPKNGEYFPKFFQTRNKP